MIRYLIILASSFSCIFWNFASAQSSNEKNIWHFGPTSFGIAFNSMLVPTVTNNSYTPYTGEGCLVMTDPITGIMKFYSDGTKIVDATHQVMPNGSGLNSHLSSFGTAELIPVPGNCNQYYVFHNNSAVEAGGGDLFYSVVDMTLPGNGTIAAPLGDVVATQKNILLSTSVAEGLEIAPKKNSHDYWVLVPNNSPSSIDVYLVTSSGVSFHANYPLISNLSDIRGMRYSGASEKIAVTSMRESQPCLIMDFNPLTGVISNQYIIPGTPMGTSNTYWEGMFDCEWSPDGTKLYFSKYRVSSPSSGGKLYQYNLSTPSIPPVLIHNVSPFSSDTGRGLRLGPDGKIYFIYSSGPTFVQSLGIINAPNQPGIACNFVANGLNMGTNLGNVHIFPEFLKFHNTIPNLPTISISINSCNSSQASYVLPLDSMLQDAEGDNLDFFIVSSTSGLSTLNGDTLMFVSSPVFNSTESVVIAFCDDFCFAKCDTFSVQFTNTLGVIASGVYPSLMSGCIGDTLITTPSVLLDTIIWSNGSTSAQQLITNDDVLNYSGVTLNGCSFSGSLSFEFHDVPVVELGPDTTFCNSTSFLVSSSGGENVLWSTGDTTNTTQLNSTGYYWVQLTDTTGCSSIDSVFVTVLSTPAYDLGPDRFSCPGAFVNETLQVASGVYDVIWSDGNTSDSMVVQSPGLVWVTLYYSNICLFTDSLLFSEYVVNESILGPDSVFCGTVNPYVLSTQLVSPQWSTGAQTQNISISTTGIYWVEGLDVNSCSVYDSIALTFSPGGPGSGIYPTTMVACIGDTLIANPTFLIDTIVWSNGSTSTQQMVSADTILNYSGITVDGCLFNGSLNFVFQNFPLVDLGPDTALCHTTSLLVLNSDGENVLWSTGDTTNFTQLNSTGYYWVQVTDSIGCSATDSVFVTVLSEPIFDLGPNRFSCPGAFVNETIQVVSGVYDALWSDGNTSDSMVVQSPGWVWLTLSSSNGCQSTDSLLFSEFVVNESILGPDTVFCEDVTPYTLSTQLNAPQWSTGAQTQNISVSTSGTYWVEALDENACEVTDSITLTFSNVAFNPLPDSSLATCAFVILDAGGYSGTLSWNNGQSSSSVLITQNGWYYVTLDNGNCTFSDSTFVLISNSVDFSMIVPNVFSPNDDGVNDYFEIPVVAGECEFDLDVIIYDRWGLEMYRSVNNTVHWDGKTIEGKKCPAGVYTVILQFQIGEESKSEIFHLTLIR